MVFGNIMKPFLGLLLACFLTSCTLDHSLMNDGSVEPMVDASEEQTDNRLSCPETTMVYPEWEERATIVNTSTDISGNEQQELVFSISSPVLLSLFDGAYKPQLVIDSVVQRPMVVNGTIMGLSEVITKSQDRCGYVYDFHVMFINTGCEQRICNLLRVGQRIRVQINTCSPTGGVCTQGAVNTLTISG